MNKLQLYIYKSVRGFKSMRNINPSEGVQRHIRDVRKALELIDYDPAEKYLFYLLTYIPDGSFFTILRTIPGQKGDHLATTVFVPRGLQIQADEMADIVHRTVRTVSNPAVTAEDLGTLHELFAREYPTDPDAPMTVASEGREYAFSLYGGQTGRSLADFYGPRLYQPDLLPYAGLLLVDADLGVEVDAPDLTEMALAETVALLPPGDSADGFAPHIYRHRFDRPFLVPLGADVDITWRRQGFEDRQQVVTVKTPGMTPDLIETADARKVVAPSSFYVTSQSTKEQVNGAAIEVNGTPITGPTHFTLSQLTNARVKVTAPGFFTFRSTLDLASTTQALIQLQELRRIYRFEIPVVSAQMGAPIHFELHSKDEIDCSPIEGYAVRDGELHDGANRINYLDYQGAPGGFAARWLVGVGATALLVGLLAGWLLFRTPAPTAPTEDIESADTLKTLNTLEILEPEKPAESVVAEPAKTAESAKTSVPGPEALKYLDENPKWSRPEMEANPGLAGLWDDMNSFNFDRLTGHWAQTLKGSKAFERVAHHAAESRRKHIFKAEGTYNRAGDEVIAIQNYLNRIDPAKK